MVDNIVDRERKLSDYPISLRQSARAVFGSAYERAEKGAPVPESAEEDRLLARP